MGDVKIEIMDPNYEGSDEQFLDQISCKYQIEHKNKESLREKIGISPIEKR